jgi:hypothetical protein
MTEVEELRVIDDAGAVDVVETDFLDTGKCHKSLSKKRTAITRIISE